MINIETLPTPIVKQLNEITQTYNRVKKPESPALTNAQVAQILLSEAIMNPVTISIFEEHFVRTYWQNTNPPVKDGGYYSERAAIENRPALTFDCITCGHDFTNKTGKCPECDTQNVYEDISLEKSDFQKALEADLPIMRAIEEQRDTGPDMDYEDDGQPDFNKEITDLEGDELPAETEDGGREASEFYGQEREDTEQEAQQTAMEEFGDADDCHYPGED